jgi:hypothetical protein
MKQLNSYRLYELGAKLHSLLGGEGCGRVADMFVPLSDAQSMLDSFIKGDAVALSTSKADAVKLLNKIGAIFNRYFIDSATKQLKPQDGEDRIDTHELSILRALVEKFEHALGAELNHAPTYVAGKRGIYSTYDLAENAEDIFSENLRPSIPATAQKEFAASGRALAFGLGTASALHTLRAVEIMLRAYYEAFVGAAPAKTERNYSVYLKKLAALAEEEDRAVRPDKRVLQMLAQVKDNYRNPLASVDTEISIDEATQLFGLAGAIIAAMAEAVAARRRSAAASAGAALSESAEAHTLAPSLIGSGDEGGYDFQMREAG